MAVFGRIKRLKVCLQFIDECHGVWAIGTLRIDYYFHIWSPLDAKRVLMVKAWASAKLRARTQVIT
jgi:hypothetical protein